MANHLDLIARFEGYRAEPYWDHQQWSVGYGSYAGGRDPRVRPNITVSQSEARRMLADQVRTYEANVDKYDSTYNWTPNERAAMVSFAYNIGSIDSLTANGTRTKEEIAAKMLEYNKASGQIVPGLVDRRRAEFDVFTGGAPLRDFQSGIASSGVEGANTTAAVNDPNSSAAFTGDFQAAGNMSDLWTIAESSGNFWENELDQYEMYTYNLELFCIDEQTTSDFLEEDNPEYDFDQIINGSWPTADTKRTTIAMTGATTEFNIQDLNVDSLGYGAGNNARMSGNAVRLNFDIVQVGNTSLADSLQNAAILMGYTSTHDAVWFIKVKFLGYFDSYGETIQATKVLPFKISNFADLSTTTDARGTVTTIEGTIIQQTAFDSTNGQIDNNMVVPIGQTLEETLNNFIEKLNDRIEENNFANDSKFVNTYKFEMSEQFKERYASSPMNGPTASNLSAAQNATSVRENGRNVAEQVAQFTPGTNIYNVLQDICVQSTLISDSLTEKTDTFSDTFNIVPIVVPKPNGLNVLTNTRGYNITYFFEIRRTPIIQHQADLYDKVTNCAKMIDEIFTQGRCRKVYYYQYTGLNDQILDLQISLNKQLQKAYVAPTDNYIWASYLNQEGDSIDQILQAAGNQDALNTLNESRQAADTLNQDLANARNNLDSKRAAAEDFSAELRDAYVSDLRDQGVGAGEAEAIAAEAFEGTNSTLGSQIRAMGEDAVGRIFNDTRAAELSEIQRNIETASSSVSSIQAQLDREQAKQDDVAQQSIGAIMSDRVNEAVGQKVSQFTSNLNTGNDEGVILIEELETDFITRLKNEEFNGLIETMMDNPMVFRRVIIPRLLDRQTPGFWRTTNREGIELAREKYYEGLNVDISMQNATMTIKGDPFWLNNYITPKKAASLFGSSSTLDQYKNYTVDLNGQNYIMLVTNKAAGTDENDNIKIANLMIAVYSIQSVTSSFSGGLFTQTLNMIKMPFPADFKALNPTIDAEFINFEENPELRQFANTGLFDEFISQGGPTGTGTGNVVQNPDGSITITNPDGTTTTRRAMTADEKARLRELQRAKRNLDAVLANPNSTPEEIAAAEARYDDAKANSPLANPNSEITDESIAPDRSDANGTVEPLNPASEEDVNSLLDGGGELDPRGSKLSVSGDATGKAPRTVHTEFEPNTLTTEEAEQARAIQAEMRDMLRQTPLMRMSDTEYARLKQLESSFNDIVDNATTGTRGEVADELVEREKRSDLEQSKADLAKVQDDVDKFSVSDLIPGNQAEDEALRDELKQKVLAQQSTTQPDVMTEVVTIKDPITGEDKLVPVYEPSSIEDNPVVIPKPQPPLPTPHIDNGDGTITIEGPPLKIPETTDEAVLAVDETSLTIEQKREYIDALSSNNGIKVKQFIDSLPEDQQNEILSLQETQELVKLPGSDVDYDLPEFQGVPPESAQEMTVARTVYDNIANQVSSLPKVAKTFTYPDGTTDVEMLPDFSQLQDVKYVDANGEIKTMKSEDVLTVIPEYGWTPTVSENIKRNIAKQLPSISVGTTTVNSESEGGVLRQEVGFPVFSIEKQEDSEE